MAKQEAPCILVIDDEDAIRFSYQDFLEDYAYRVLTAENGRVGLDLFEREEVDLILLDLRMPEVDGLEVLGRVREQSPQTPTIVVSGTGHVVDVIEALRLGACDYLLKPIADMETLRQAVENGLDRARKLKQTRAYQGHLEAQVSRRTEQIERIATALQEAHNTLETRVAERTIELVEANRRLQDEIAERRRVEEALRESEHRTRTILDCVQAGILLIDAATHCVVDANPVALSLIGAAREELVGHECHQFICPAQKGNCPITDLGMSADTVESTLITLDGRRIPVQKTVVPIMLGGHRHLLESFVDVSDLRNLLDQQELDIGLSKDLLDLVDAVPARTQNLSVQHALAIEGIRMPCAAEGGDHFFVRPLGSPAAKTVLSLKDETGHEVRCILRSIVTDLIHNALLHREPDLPLVAIIEHLNNELCASALVGVENFLTAITAEIDHESLELTYVAAGHPPFLFIRGDQVMAIPESGSPGANLALALLADTAFTAGTVTLQAGDKLVFYTDGLTEMPIQNGGRRISTSELVRIARDEIDLALPVTDFVHALLNRIAIFSGLEGTPFQKNTSDDDITLLGIEVEDRTRCEEQVWQVESQEALLRQASELSDHLTHAWKERGFLDPESRLAPTIEAAVLNAHTHGNGGEIGKTVTLRWRFGNDFHLEVAAEGSGIDSEATPGESLTAQQACGVSLDRSQADETQWEGDGRQLTASFRKIPNPAEKDRRERAQGRMDLWR